MNGFLIIDKSPGMTSYDVIKRLKRLHPFKKIGYIGTLDRNATGILPVALNEGVKLIPFLENGEKRYVARFVLGIDDGYVRHGGNQAFRDEPPVYERAVLEEALSRFKGRITQKIPVYSSKKVEGKPLYKWVRQGIPIDPPNKEVEVYDLIFLDYVHPYVDVEISCSKGTYIRVIAHDFGTILGCGAALHTLKRTRHGEFEIARSVVLDYLKGEAGCSKLHGRPGRRAADVQGNSNRARAGEVPEERHARAPPRRIERLEARGACEAHEQGRHAAGHREGRYEFKKHQDEKINQ